MPENIEIHSAGTQRIYPKNWICCFDCGLLIRPTEKGAKEWSICPLCTAVYKVGAEHPWIAKMLACHINGLPPNKGRLSHFTCIHCHNVFLQMAANKAGGPVCYWCKEKGYKLPRSGVAEKKCLICDRAATGHALSSGICKTCLTSINKVKKTLEYVYYIFGKNRSLHR